MNIQLPCVLDVSLAEACAWADAHTEPAFVPATVHADDRGWSIMNQFQQVLSAQGQINYTVMYPGVIKAWHRHHQQTDLWLCLHGHIKAGIHRQQDDAAWQIVMGERRPGVLIIPPPLWHGAATVGDQQAGMLYYVTRSYDPSNPDEDRRPFDALTEFPWMVVHR